MEEYVIFVKKQNHFAVKCRDNKNVDVVEYKEQICEYICLDEIQNKNTNTWLETIKINDK